MIGFEKARNDSGLVFYNVENILAKRYPGGVASQHSRFDGLPLTDSSVPIINQYGTSQGAHSACWTSNLSFVGMGSKWIRGYTLLDSSSAGDFRSLLLTN